jgi:hypothetical protein
MHKLSFGFKLRQQQWQQPIAYATKGIRVRVEWSAAPAALGPTRMSMKVHHVLVALQGSIRGMLLLSPQIHISIALLASMQEQLQVQFVLFVHRASSRVEWAKVHVLPAFQTPCRQASAPLKVNVNARLGLPE